MSLLEITDLRKEYRSPSGTRVCVLDVPAFALDAGEQVAVAGASGSGKTTLLNIVAGLVRPDAGRVVFDGTEISALGEAARDAFRARHMGYVFQTFHLLEGFDALGNVLLGMAFGPGADESRARALLTELGLGSHLSHHPSQLSAGQKQRVALARALACRPRLVLADEPTGNLDPERAHEALDLIRAQCEAQGAALLLVSHDPRILGDFDRVESFGELNRAHG